MLADKLDIFPSKKAILNFYWDKRKKINFPFTLYYWNRDMAGKSIKAKTYRKK